MADIIQNTINKVLQDGARVSKFKCYIQLPTPFTNLEGKELDTIIKTTAFPTRSNEVITIQHKGRDIPLPGQEKFLQELEVSFYMQEDHRNKIIFDQWSEALNFDRYNDDSDPFVVALASNQDALRTSITLTQMDFGNNEDRCSYTFHNVFPKMVQGSAASSEAIDTIGEFTVIFIFSHYTIKQDKRTSEVSRDLDYLPFDSGVVPSTNKRGHRNLVKTDIPYQETKFNWIG